MPRGSGKRENEDIANGSRDARKKGKPYSAKGTNVLLELDALRCFILDNSYCTECGLDKIEENKKYSSVTESTIGMASTIHIRLCPHEKQHHRMLSPPQTDQLYGGRGKRNIIVTYVTNLMAVLMSQMLGKGIEKAISVVCACLALPFNTRNTRGWKTAGKKRAKSRGNYSTML